MADNQLDTLVICGSLRKGSYNAALTRALPKLAPPGLKLRSAPSFEKIPIYNFDIQNSTELNSVRSIGTMAEPLSR